jgi:hypothetical protein
LVSGEAIPLQRLGVVLRTRPSRYMTPRLNCAVAVPERQRGDTTSVPRRRSAGPHGHIRASCRVKLPFGAPWSAARRYRFSASASFSRHAPARVVMRPRKNCALALPGQQRGETTSAPRRRSAARPALPVHEAENVLALGTPWSASGRKSRREVSSRLFVCSGTVLKRPCRHGCSRLNSRTIAGRLFASMRSKSMVDA